MESSQIVEKLCANMIHQESKRGETLIRTGDIPDKFYVILKGQVMVLKKKDP